MAKKKLAHGDIEVTIDDEDADVDVISEPVEDPGSTDGFTVLEVLGNIFFHKKGKDHKKIENQVDKFKKKIKLEIPVPPSVLNHSRVKNEGKDILKLAYYDKSQSKWILFSDQSLDKQKNIGTVNFNQWIKDPPIGWGLPD